MSIYPNLRSWREDHKADGNLRIIGMRGEIDNALAELDALRAEVAEIEDDLLYAMQVRHHALTIAAGVVQPGPDGQDYIDRERMIVAWIDEAHERASEHERPLRPIIERLQAERDLAVVQRDALRAQVPRWVPVTERAPQHGDTVLWLWPDGEIRLRMVTDFLGHMWEPLPSHWMPLPAAPSEEQPT